MMRGEGVAGRGASGMAPSAIAAILMVQAAIGLYLGLPGQLSVDSIVQLYEGRTSRFMSIHPPLMSILLGVLDRAGDAPVGFVLLSQALLSGSTWIVLSDAKRAAAWRVTLAAMLLLNPVVLSYVGIVWKDVLLAHSAVFLYLLIARLRDRGTALTVPLALLLLALLVLVVGARQQGMLLALPAAAWAAMLAGPSKRARALALIAFVAIPLAADRLAYAYANHHAVGRTPDRLGVGWRIMVQFDVVGILANGGALSPATPPQLAEELRRQTRGYNPQRVDTLTGPSDAYWSLNAEQARALWLGAIDENRWAYLKHRTRCFVALLGLDDTRACVPVHSGVVGPVVQEDIGKDLVAALGLTPGPSHASRLVYAFAGRTANNPLFMPVVYAVLVLACCPALVRRREHVLLTLAGASLALLASHLLVGIACDFRYVYTLVLAATLLAARRVLTGAQSLSAPA
jgi:hypothetical protein